MKTPAPDRRPLFKKGGEANNPGQPVQNARAQHKSRPRPSQSEGGAKPDGNAGLLIKAAKTAAEEAAREALEDALVYGPGTLVGVRMQPDLLAKLDKYRGGQTRPQAIREILEKNL